MDLINNILNGLGETRDYGGSSSRSGMSTTTSTNEPPLTAEEETALHKGGSYSSNGGLVERWYIDETTGRKIYTYGEKAGTFEQVKEPNQTVNTSMPTANKTEEEKDYTTLFLILPIAALLAMKLMPSKKRKKR